jgi:hypothetical protein
MVRSAANTNIAVDQARVDQAMVEWNMTGVLKGEGDSGMWRLATEFERAGVPVHERTTLLIEAAKNADNPQNRLRQVQRIVLSRQRLGRRKVSHCQG